MTQADRLPRHELLQGSVFDIFGTPGAAPEDLEFYQVLSRMGLAAFLGLVVAGLYRHSCRSREGAPGLSTSLVLLSMLICMVMMTVGSNVAGAFTLVGTLAIVRFRTAVRDTRDTAFVIFAVGVGMTSSGFSYNIALFGTASVGAMTLILHALPIGRAGVFVAPELARLEVRLDPTSALRTSLLEIIGPHASDLRVLATASRGPGKPVVMRWSLLITDPDTSSQLIQELMALPGVTRASLTFMAD